MNLDHLRYFVKLAEVRHYTRAAEHLCISQPSLSHAINQLESELGVPLFERTGRNTTLTRFGEEFLECAQRSLGALDVGIDSLQRSRRARGSCALAFCGRSALSIFRSSPRISSPPTPTAGYSSAFIPGCQAGLSTVYFSGNSTLCSARSLTHRWDWLRCR